MTRKCTKCGYPVIEKMTTCPNCGAIVADEDTDFIICPACGAHVDAREEYCPECGEPLYSDGEKQTDDLSAAPDIIPVCTLRPIAIGSERSTESRTFEDGGDGVELFRGNTMPSDDSIDEDLQAHLFFCDGQWFIEEGCEDRRSTFVHAGKGIKLTPGDFIRLGNREFEFNIKTK